MGRKKQRGNGDGSVVTIRRKGKVIGYAPEITLHREGEAPRRKRGALCKTRGEAEVALAALLKAVEHGVDVTAPALTLRAYTLPWFEDTFKPRARPKSRETYKDRIDDQILPHLGDIVLKKLNPPRIRQWLAHLQKPKAEGGAGLSPKTATLCRTVLSAILSQAVEDGLIDRNPIDRKKVPAPKLPPSRKKALTIAQAKALLEALRGNRYELAIRLMLVFALRRGEVAGLKWEHIHLDGDTPYIEVAGTLGYAKEEGLHYGEPKTPKGRRRLRLPLRLAASLTWHRSRQEAERKAMGWEVSPYVFVSPKTGGPLNSNAIYVAFTSASKAVGLVGFSPHSARHSVASFLHAENVSIKRISEGLGHANTSITLNLYTHLADDLHDIGEHVDRLLDDDDTPPAEEANQA
jgi:integrase